MSTNSFFHCFLLLVFWHKVSFLEDLCFITVKLIINLQIYKIKHLSWQFLLIFVYSSWWFVTLWRSCVNYFLNAQWVVHITIVISLSESNLWFCFFTHFVYVGDSTKKSIIQKDFFQEILVTIMTFNFEQFSFSSFFW